MRRALALAVVALGLAVPATAGAASPDSLAPRTAPPHWLPPEAWVYNHWLPFDEQRLYDALGTDRAGVWRQLRDDWARTAERVRSMPAGSEYLRVDGEWSMVETLRHLVFVHDSWFRRCVLGRTDLFTAMGLASPFVPDQEEQGLDSSARPSLDEVLGVRDRQASELEAWLAEVTPEQLAQTAPVPDGAGWPPYARGRRVRQCLGTVLDEEWAHHGFCVRDLDKM